MAPLDRHPLADAAYREQCRATLDVEGALVLPALVPAAVIDSIVAEVAEWIMSIGVASEATRPSSASAACNARCVANLSNRLKRTNRSGVRFHHGVH